MVANLSGVTIGVSFSENAQGEMAVVPPILKLLAFLKLTDMDPFTAWFVVTGRDTRRAVGSCSH